MFIHNIYNRINYTIYLVRWEFYILYLPLQNLSQIFVHRFKNRLNIFYSFISFRICRFEQLTQHFNYFLWVRRVICLIIVQLTNINRQLRSLFCVAPEVVGIVLDIFSSTFFSTLFALVFTSFYISCFILFRVLSKSCILRFLFYPLTCNTFFLFLVRHRLFCLLPTFSFFAPREQWV